MNNNTGLRDPIWTFIGVVIAIIGVGVSILALFPQLLRSDTSPAVTPSPSISSPALTTHQVPGEATGVCPLLAFSYNGSFVDTSVSPAQTYPLSLYAVTEHPPSWSSQASLGGIISNATEQTTTTGTITENGLITFTIPVPNFHLQNEQFSFMGTRSSSGQLSGNWQSSGDAYGTASGNWQLQPGNSSTSLSSRGKDIWN